VDLLVLQNSHLFDFAIESPFPRKLLIVVSSLLSLVAKFQLCDISKKIEKKYRKKEKKHERNKEKKEKEEERVFSFVVIPLLVILLCCNSVTLFVSRLASLARTSLGPTQ